MELHHAGYQTVRERIIANFRLRTSYARLINVLTFVVVLVATHVQGTAGEKPPTLKDDVQPLLKSRCVKCHGPVKPKGKLNLSSPRSLARGGENGSVVEADSPDESALWEKVA